MVEDKVNLYDQQYDPETMNPGAYQIQTTHLAGASKLICDKARQELGKRTLEEMVELCLALGVSPGDIHLHVTDALHNECKKLGIYPSEWDTKKAAHSSKAADEVIDVEICVDMIRALLGYSRAEIEEHKKTKLELLRLRIRDGNYKVINEYRVYKKDR